jgi:hypothetical protein
MTTAIVSGAIANKCQNGGATWTRLNWALGLMQLGFDVHFIEQIEPEHCVDENGNRTSFEESANLRYFRRVTEQYGLAGTAALIYAGGEQIHGAGREELEDVAASAELLVNISGHLTLSPLRNLPHRKVYIDLDPGYTQYWHATGNLASHLEGYDLYFTVGQNIGAAGCPIPTCGIDWRPICQPVVLDLWPTAREGDPDRFTTIASWRGPYGRVEHEAGLFGLKAHQFRKFIDMPQRVDATLEIALDIHPADSEDLHLLEDRGWNIVDPAAAVPDPESFQRYVQSSGAEFSVAQGIYIETRSGWFSDRTVRYLASGKPALVQDTGLARRLPIGDGLLTFQTIDDAVAGAQRISQHYDNHRMAARAIAEEFFDARVALEPLVDTAGVAP